MKDQKEFPLFYFYPPIASNDARLQRQGVSIFDNAVDVRDVLPSDDEQEQGGRVHPQQRQNVRLAAQQQQQSTHTDGEHGVQVIHSMLDEANEAKPVSKKTGRTCMYKCSGCFKIYKDTTTLSSHYSRAMKDEGEKGQHLKGQVERSIPIYRYAVMTWYVHMDMLVRKEVIVESNSQLQL